MEYQFVRTMNGPMMVGYEEVLTLHQWPQMMDYYNADPEFIAKAQQFLENAIKDFSEIAILSIREPVMGLEYVRTLPQYLVAIDALKGFEKFIAES